jgi:serine/threonine protein kinase
VMDWGIANRHGGTTGYVAPEQKLGEISPAADVFALGTILRQLAGTSAPRRLRKIIAKATAARKEDRYPTARELAADVRAFLDSREAAARNRALIAIIAAYLAMRVIVLLLAHH